MTPADLRAWQAQMGYTYETAAEALGMSRSGFAKLLAGANPIDRRTELACAAIAAGLGADPASLVMAAASEHYFTAADGAFAADDGPHSDVADRRNIPDVLNYLTICVLVMKDGRTVTGQSACAGAAVFDGMTERQRAKADAMKKVAHKKEVHPITQADGRPGGLVVSRDSDGKVAQVKFVG